MKVPKCFLKDKKGLEKKIQEYSLDITESEILKNSLNEEEMTDEICKYMNTLFYHPYYRDYVKEQVRQLNHKKPKVLFEIKNDMNKLETELERYNIKWDWIAKDHYNDWAYKKAKSDIKRFWVKTGMVYYSKIANYVPARAARFFFRKSNTFATPPTRWDLLGMASYCAALAGETLLVGAVLGYWWVFAGLTLVTGIVDGTSTMEDERKMLKQHKEFVKEYGKIIENKKKVESLKAEKQQITGLINEHIK